jgi:hypothetical protein
MTNNVAKRTRGKKARRREPRSQAPRAAGNGRVFFAEDETLVGRSVSVAPPSIAEVKTDDRRECHLQNYLIAFFENYLIPGS